MTQCDSDAMRFYKVVIVQARSLSRHPPPGVFIRSVSGSTIRTSFLLVRWARKCLLKIYTRKILMRAPPTLEALILAGNPVVVVR